MLHETRNPGSMPRADSPAELEVPVVRVGVATIDRRTDRRQNPMAGASAPGHLLSPTVIIHAGITSLSWYRRCWHTNGAKGKSVFGQVRFSASADYAMTEPSIAGQSGRQGRCGIRFSRRQQALSQRARRSTYSPEEDARNQRATRGGHHESAQ